MADYKTVVEFISSQPEDKQTIVQTVRSIILDSAEGIVENIKWNAPNYKYKNIDRLTFNLQNKENIVKLVLHFGAGVAENKKGKPILHDSDKIVIWKSDIRGYINIDNLEFLQKNQAKIEKTIKDWLNIKIAE